MPRPVGSSTISPSSVTFTSVDALISSNSRPYALIRKCVLGARHARGDVRVDEVGQPEVRGEPIARGEVDAQRPHSAGGHAVA